MFSTGKLRVVLLSSFLLLNACGGSEDREQKYLERAQAYFNDNNYDKTRVELKNVLQINPKNIEARYMMALLAEKQQNWRKMYGMLLGIVETNPAHLKAQNKLGKLFLFSGQVDKALAKAELVLVADANNTDALILQAAIYMNQGELTKSAEIIRSVLASDPGNIEATVILAKQYANNKQYKDALQLLDSAISIHPDELSLALFKIDYLVALKSFPEAESVFASLVARFSDNAALHYNFAKFYIAWGNLDKAEQVLHDYIALDPIAVEPKLALSEFLLQQRGVEAAEQALKKLISENPESYDFRFALVSLYKNKPTQAIAELNEIVRLDVEGEAGLKANNLLARFSVQQGDTAQASQILDNIIAQDSGNSEALMLRSTLLVDKGDFEAAIADLRTVMRNDPDSEKAFMLSANAHFKSGYFDLAEDSLEKALILNPGNTQVRKNLARLLVRNKDDQAAIELLEAMDLSSKDNADVMVMLVDLYIRTQAWDKAIALAQSIANINNTGLSSYKLGQVFFAQQKYSLAITEYEKVLLLQPLNIEVLAQLSKSYLSMGNPKQAEKMLDTLIAKNSKNAALLNLKGEVFSAARQADSAKLVFEKVIGLDKKFAAGYRNLASIHAAQKNYQKAKEIFKSGLQELPEDTGLLLGLASTYEINRELDAAIDTYARLLKVDQNNKIAANNLAALIANTSDNTERLKYALSLVKTFKNYKVPALLDTYAWLSYLNGEYDAAVIAMERVVAIVPDFPEFEYHLGMIYAASGRTEEAMQVLEKAVAGGVEFTGFDKAREKLKELKTK